MVARTLSGERTVSRIRKEVAGRRVQGRCAGAPPSTVSVRMEKTNMLQAGRQAGRGLRESTSESSNGTGKQHRPQLRTLYPRHLGLLPSLGHVHWGHEAIQARGFLGRRGWTSKGVYLYYTRSNTPSQHQCPHPQVTILPLFTHTYSFRPHNNPRRWTRSFWIYRWGNESPRKFSNSPKVTPLLSSEKRVWTWKIILFPQYPIASKAH